MNDRVLVVVGYTDMKWYARPLWPRAYNDLSWKYKELLFVTDQNLAGLSDAPSGDDVAARSREYGVSYAITGGHDWVLFLDVDVIPDVGIIEQLLKVGKPFVAGVTASRGNATEIIGHNYGSFEKLDRWQLNYTGQAGVHAVDGVAAACMMVHRSIFTKARYTGYKGVGTIPGRTTCDDEFYCINVRKLTGERPYLDLSAKVWHLHTDGFAYRYWGSKQAYKRTKTAIFFQGRQYEADQK